MIFPLWPIWLYPPHAWCCAVLWNLCETLKLPCPWAPDVFGIILGAKVTKIEKDDT